LGWAACFGDPHAEAWSIINSPFMGLQARANKSYETLNPLAHNCNWFDILRRVLEASFRFTAAPKLSYRESQEACTRPRNAIIDQIEQEFMERLAEMYHAVQTQRASVASRSAPRLSASISTSTVATSSAARRLDDDEKGREEPTDEPLFDALGNYVSTPEMLLALSTDSIEFDRSSEQCGTAPLAGLEGEEGPSVPTTASTTVSNEGTQPFKPPPPTHTIEQERQMLRAAKIEELLRTNGGIERQAVLEYGVEVVLQMSNINVLTVSIAALQVGATLVPSTAGVLLPLVASLSMLTVPVLLLGLVGLATTGISLTFGSSEGMCVRTHNPEQRRAYQSLCIRLLGLQVACYGRV